MDCANFIKQLVVVEDRDAVREDNDASAGESTINDVTDALRRGRNRNVLLVEHFVSGVLLDMRRRQLHLDDVRAELSRGGVTDNVDR